MPSNLPALSENPCAHCGGCATSCGAGSILPNPPVQTPTHLSQWPIKLHQVNPAASFFRNANLLVAADCAACACGDFHQRFLHNRAALIGCARWDTLLLRETLSKILQIHPVRTVTVLSMDSPCCAAFAQTARETIQESGKFIPWQLLYLSTDGQVTDQK